MIKIPTGSTATGSDAGMSFDAIIDKIKELFAKLKDAFSSLASALGLSFTGLCP